ncbi:hypothetical protein [Legionella cardiaca]|uniref:Coiled coil protein n=1 Tax=Legionella cardiaca TaxID=1071983 RepID=A0ABY8AMV6_9GAMM|nr:hypothetical protein [Legionella cardiaca]WED42018.1 hypothetical protein PXX05_08725 [Legionella cardiaca]
MPFFPMRTPEEIKRYCKDQPLEELIKLNHRYGNFFERISEQEDKNNEAIDTIKLKIDILRKELEKKEQEGQSAESNHRKQFEGLPGNGAERYLALSALRNSSIQDNDCSVLEKPLKELIDEKKKLEEYNGWIKYEMHSCAQELKIINKVIENKRLVQNTKPMAYSSE